MQIEEAIEKLKETAKQCRNSKECWENEDCCDCYVEVEDIFAIETVLNYIDTMHKELDRLEGIEDNTSMLKQELKEQTEANKELNKVLIHFKAVINEMAVILTRYMSTIDNKPYDLSIGQGTRRMTVEEIIQYFSEKVSE